MVTYIKKVPHQDPIISGLAVDSPLDDKKNCNPSEITGRCLQPAVIEDNNTFNPQIM